MKEKELDLVVSALLYIIKKNLDISELFKFGIVLSQIPALLKYIEDNGYCQRIENKYVLTIKGQQHLKDFLPCFTISTKKVKPLYEMRISRLPTDEIFLPKFSPMI